MHTAHQHTYIWINGVALMYIYIYIYLDTHTNIHWHNIHSPPTLVIPKELLKSHTSNKNTPQMEADVAARRVVEQRLGCLPYVDFFGGSVSLMPFKNGRALKWGFGVGSFFFGFQGKRSGHVEDFVGAVFFFFPKNPFFLYTPED